MTEQALAARIRAALRLLGNEEITPAGRRILEKILDTVPPEGFVNGTERLDRMLEKYPSKQWGVRMPDGTLHYGLSQGDAENLEVTSGGQLVRWSNDGWEDQE